jgi:Tol biopolymer transport system component
VMGPERMQQIEALFHAALERHAAERSAFLAAACGTDEALRRDVESLLQHLTAADVLLTSPMAEAGASIQIDNDEHSLVGRHVGVYEVLARLGAGGMGEVYRARDPRLHRDVAIKVLPQAFMADGERRSRFESEARLLAALNHPNIGAIYGVEDADGVRSLVLELVEGLTLAERLAGGALPIEEALRVARQLADALEAAHDKGIVHRDLKPANIKITQSGTVKVLDFGIAKAVLGAGPQPDPSTWMGRTRHGVILGTAAYMSPEQARGIPVDKRTDIWAFGCVLYEMLTGREAFAGATVSDTLAAVLGGEPDWNGLPAATPASLRRLLHRCLRKDAARRLADMADARLEIEDALDPVIEEDRPAGPTAKHDARAVLAVATGLLVIAIGGAVVWSMLRARRQIPQPAARFQVGLSPGDRISGFDHAAISLSRDGSKLVYVGAKGDRQQLSVQSFDRWSSVALAGTDNAYSPFFSPDAQWIGFYADGQLKKVSINGGAPIALAVADSFGASWRSNGSIIFARDFGSGLWEVSSAGGIARQVSRVDATHGEVGHHWPFVLPGGKAVLFAIAHKTGHRFDESQIVVQSLETGERRALVEGGTSPRYVTTGHLLFLRGSTMMALPFDVEHLTASGVAVPVVDNVAEAVNGAAELTASDNGTLAYLPTERYRSTLAIVDRQGVPQRLALPVHTFASPRVSPDGSRIAVQTIGINCDIWIDDLARGTLSRLTFEGDNHFPIWTPDGQRVVFDRAGDGLFEKSATGAAAEERLTASSHGQRAASWSPDGRVLMFTDADVPQGAAAPGGDIWSLAQGSNRPQLFLKARFNEVAPQLSPDGQHVAYESSESGQSEIYVRPFPTDGPKLQISTEGGHEPLWASNGRELFYRTGDKIMVSEIRVGPPFTAGNPHVLFEEPDYPFHGFGTYDVMPDGKHFVFVENGGRHDGSADLRVILNWFQDLTALVATR